MKVFAIIALVGLVSAMPQKSPHQGRDLKDQIEKAEDFLADVIKNSQDGVCCDQTPCFIGCPVNGEFKVGFLIRVQVIQVAR